MIELTFLIPDEDFAREVERGLQILEESPFKRRLAELVAIIEKADGQTQQTTKRKRTKNQ